MNEVLRPGRRVLVEFKGRPTRVGTIVDFETTGAGVYGNGWRKVLLNGNVRASWYDDNRLELMGDD